MSKRIDLLPEVLVDIENARDWYASRNPEVADRFLGDLGRVLESIERHPRLGGYHDAERKHRARQLTKFPFLIVYREFEDRTRVVAVYHTSRDPGYWKRRL